jgi:hypothetical protein
MCRRSKTCGLAVGIAAIVCLVLIYFLGMREEETAQAYLTDGGYFTSTPTVRVSVLESNLSILQQFGGGEVIFSGGKGFVHFQVREDGSIVVLVPGSASLPCRLPVTWAKFFIADNHKFHHIRLTHEKRQRIQGMKPLQYATEREVAYPGTAPHIFIEAELGLDTARALVMAETILA